MFMVILTLPAVVSHVAFLTQAVILCTRSPVHTANITVLDCGQNNTNTHRQRQTHRATLGLKIRNIHGILDLQHKQNVLWTILFKVVLKYIFLEIYGLQTDERIRLKRCELQESNMEEMLTVDVFQKTHTPSRLTHTRSQQLTRLTAFCKNVIATYVNCLGQFQGCFQEVLWLCIEYFCTRLVSAHYSWWGEENLKKQMHSVVWSQNSEPIISSLIFTLETAYFLSSTFCHYCFCLVKWFVFRLQLLYPKNAKTGVWSESCIPKMFFDIHSC